jgi:hypothetical protein
MGPRGAPGVLMVVVCGKGVYDEAIAVLTNAMDEGDDTPVLFHLRGRALLKLGQAEKVLRGGSGR